MLKSPFGILLGAAAIVLAVSPEARKAARRLAVKGTELLLDVTDQIKDAASVRETESKIHAEEMEQQTR